MNRFLVALSVGSLLPFFTSVSGVELQYTLASSAATRVSLSQPTYKIIDATNTAFGHDIYAAGRMIIHQPSRPALLGNEAFKSESDAATKCGVLRHCSHPQFTSCSTRKDK